MRKMIWMLAMALMFSACATAQDRQRAAQEAARFVDNGDGTITDYATSLIWKKSLFGLYTWAEAQEKAEKKRGWRLPTEEEFKSIVVSPRSLSGSWPVSDFGPSSPPDKNWALPGLIFNQFVRVYWTDSKKKLDAWQGKFLSCDFFCGEGERAGIFLVRDQ